MVPNDEPVEDVIPAVRQLYQSKIGSLMYLMLGTRPDLAYSIGKLASFSSNPSSHHIHALDRVLLYLHGSVSLHLDWWPEEENLAPTGFTDADFAGDSSDRKSIGAYCFNITGTVFSWSSKKESTIATSTMEAEYIALYMGSQQATWIYQFYKQIGFPLDEPIEIFCDSQPALSVAKGEETHRKAKHLDVDLHSVRERVTLGQIQLTLGTKGGVPGWYTGNTLQGHGQSTHHIPTWALEVHSEFSKLISLQFPWSRKYLVHLQCPQ